MSSASEGAFLRSIAEEPEDNALRLVFADWLDEHGEGPRADFIRVQCELASANLSEERRRALRVRERELLDTHWLEWCQAFGLDIEEVGFERGLLSRMRLSRWDGGTMLAAECAPRLATLKELDLSELHLDAKALTTFAETANLPSLRKLILSDNIITDTGATALAEATGLPRLDTIYLFRNPISDDALAVLDVSPHFLLATLDLGERAEGYCMSPGEAEMARRKYLRTFLFPTVSQYFQTHERLRSAMLCVAQYWNDNASDAVHGLLILSELLEPTLEGVAEFDPRADRNIPNTRLKHRCGSGSALALWDIDREWDQNRGAIPLWAAFAPEGGSQEYSSYSEVYAPAVMFYRHGGYEILPVRRPQLDGVRPEYGWEE
jgi:uncharacterized protein (TIGR02996 family)